MLAVVIIRKAKDVYKQPQKESREKSQLSEKFVRPPVNEILQEGSDDTIKMMMEKKVYTRKRMRILVRRWYCLQELFRDRQVW